jgi:nicotinamidase-related amidase
MIKKSILAGLLAIPLGIAAAVKNYSDDITLAGLDSDNTAIVLIDMHPFYYMDYNALDSQELEETLSNQEDLLRYADDHGIQVYAVQYGADRLDSRLERVLPEDAERVVKNSQGAFATTDLEQRLNEQDIDNVVLAGLYSTLCVLDTAKEAYQRGFNVLTAEDLVIDRGFNSQYNDAQEEIDEIGVFVDDYKVLLDRLED